MGHVGVEWGEHLAAIGIDGSLQFSARAV